MDTGLPYLLTFGPTMEKKSQLGLLDIPETASGKLACGWKLGEFLLVLFTPPPARGKGVTGGQQNTVYVFRSS